MDWNMMIKDKIEKKNNTPCFEMRGRLFAGDAT